MLITPGITITGGTRINGDRFPSYVVRTNMVLYIDPHDVLSYSGSGTTVTDLSGQGNDLTMGGGSLPTFVSSPVASFAFNRTSGDSGNNRLNTSSNFLGDDMTLQCWIKTSGVGYGTLHYQLMFIMAAEAGGGNDGWGFGLDNSGKLVFGNGSSSGTNLQFTSVGFVDTGEWLNVAATRKKSTGAIKLYVNGQLAGQGTGNAGNSLNAAAQIWIGDGQTGPSFTMGGNIGSIFAYNAVLTDDNILENFEATKDIYGI